MKSLALALTLTVLAGAALAAERPITAPAPNTLTTTEKAGGWRLLFDGRTTAGWKGFKSPAPDAGWSVRDGALSPDPKTSKDIVTKGAYENFELSFEWKIAPKGNSGVMFHVIEVGDETYQSGLEYQVLDNAHGEPPLQRAGGLYALYAPTTDATKPPGEFNQGRIVVDHGHVQHWLNGVLVADYEIGSADFKARVAASKFRQWPQFASARTGAIALQCHGNEVAFRSLKIRLLKSGVVA